MIDVKAAAHDLRAAIALAERTLAALEGCAPTEEKRKVKYLGYLGDSQPEAEDKDDG